MLGTTRDEGRLLMPLLMPVPNSPHSNVRSSVPLRVVELSEGLFDVHLCPLRVVWVGRRQIYRPGYRLIILALQSRR